MVVEVEEASNVDESKFDEGPETENVSESSVKVKVVWARVDKAENRRARQAVNKGNEIIVTGETA